MPADPVSDDIKTIALEVVEKPPRRNPWRPTVLTVRKFLKICHWVEKGLSITGACELEAISYARLRQRVQRSERLAKRLEQAEKTRFARRHEEMLQIITEAASKSWMAAGWWLERNLPARYSLTRGLTRDISDVEQQPLCDKVSLEELIEMAKIAAEIAANPPPGLAQNQAASLPSEAETA
jgi:hypothetical protein